MTQRGLAKSRKKSKLNSKTAFSAQVAAEQSLCTATEEPLSLAIKKNSQILCVTKNQKQKENELPSFFWTDFKKTNDEKIKNKELSKEELYKLYVKGEGGYKTLAGSAVHLTQCYQFLKNLDIEEELKKSKNKEKTKKLLEKGLLKNNIKEQDIKSFIDTVIDKMFIDNQIKAINLDKDIQNYEMINSKLYKNNILYIDFDNDFNDFLNQVDGNQKELKQELMQNIDLY